MASQRSKTALAIAAALGATLVGLGSIGWAAFSAKPEWWRQIAALPRSSESEPESTHRDGEDRQDSLISDETLEEAASYLERQAPLLRQATLEQAAAYLQRLQQREREAAAVELSPAQQREVYWALEAAAKRARRQGWAEYPRRPNASNPRAYSLRRIDRIEQLKRRYQQQVYGAYGLSAQQAQRILAAGRRQHWSRPEPIAMNAPPYVAPGWQGHKGHQGAIAK